MAIQFARCEYVSRSQAKNACQKAAYNKRTRIKCERNGNVYSFVHKTDNVHHEVLLPEGASDKYLDASVLANEVERSEKRSNSQLWKEFVLALPDDQQITKEDRIELSRRFAQQCFVDKGVAAQVDIHKLSSAMIMFPHKSKNAMIMLPGVVTIMFPPLRQHNATTL